MCGEDKRRDVLHFHLADSFVTERPIKNFTDYRVYETECRVVFNAVVFVGEAEVFSAHHRVENVLNEVDSTRNFVRFRDVGED